MSLVRVNAVGHGEIPTEEKKVRVFGARDWGTMPINSRRERWKVRTLACRSAKRKKASNTRVVWHHCC